ncbi:MAG: hypothetical protein HOE90_01545 [Bacteriovoracaceae bacterium]|nr:hypothetical protein [Bacteriovoracaceae bacterium]
MKNLYPNKYKDKYFENRYACNSSEAREFISKVRKDLKESESPLTKKILVENSQWSTFMKEMTDRQRKSLEGEIKKIKDHCAQAGVMYDAGWFRDEGLSFWTNPQLMTRVVAQRSNNGQSLEKANQLYCSAMKDLERLNTKKQRAVLGLTASSLAAIPIGVLAGPTAIGALTAQASFGVGAAAGLLSLGVSSSDFYASYREYEEVQAAYQAGLSSFQDLNSASAKMYDDLFWMSLDVAGSGLDFVGFSKTLGKVLRKSSRGVEGLHTLEDFKTLRL